MVTEIPETIPEALSFIPLPKESRSETQTQSKHLSETHFSPTYHSSHIHKSLNEEHLYLPLPSLECTSLSSESHIVESKGISDTTVSSCDVSDFCDISKRNHIRRTLDFLPHTTSDFDFPVATMPNLQHQSNNKSSELESSSLQMSPSFLFEYCNSPNLSKNPDSMELPNPKASFSTTTKANLNSFPHSSTQSDSQDEAQKAFTRFIPLLRRVNIHNYVSLLLGVLKESHQVHLDDLFNLLYNGDFSDLESILKNKGAELAHSDASNTGLKLCSLILETFKRSQTSQGGLFENLQSFKLSFHEIQRRFLAMKILFGCIKQVDKSSPGAVSIQRISIYKAYYIICHKLLKKHPSISQSLGLDETLILAPSQIGKLLKIIYPNLTSKRLGRRGHSKSHYIGLTLNESMVDHETKSLLDLGIPDILYYFKKAKPNPGKTIQNRQVLKTVKPKPTLDLNSNINHIAPLYPTKPLYTFVDLACKYPDGDCSPRVWKMAPNTVPTQSEWSECAMERSKTILKLRDVDLDPVISDIRSGIFIRHTKFTLSDTVVQAMYTLSKTSCYKEMFMHLYLVVILLLFPVIVASDQEVSIASKIRLRAAVKDLVQSLEQEVNSLSLVDDTSLFTFTRTLRKMTHINEMSSSSIENTHPRSILHEMIGDVQILANTVEESNGVSALENMFIKGVLKALNAYTSESTDKILDPTPMLNVHNMLDIGASFKEIISLVTDDMSQTTMYIMDGEVRKDVPYQVFHVSVKLFHSVTLRYPAISELPIPIITFMMLDHTNGMQKASFTGFSRRGPHLSKDTFKTWWVFSSMFQEYMSVISEMVALHQAVA